MEWNFSTDTKKTFVWRWYKPKRYHSNNCYMPYSIILTKKRAFLITGWLQCYNSNMVQKIIVQITYLRKKEKKHFFCLWPSLILHPVCWAGTKIVIWVFEEKMIVDEHYESSFPRPGLEWWTIIHAQAHTHHI